MGLTAAELLAAAWKAQPLHHQSRHLETAQGKTTYQVVVVGVKELGHVHGELVLKSACHSKVALDALQALQESLAGHNCKMGVWTSGMAFEQQAWQPEAIWLQKTA